MQARSAESQRPTSVIVEAVAAAQRAAPAQPVPAAPPAGGDAPAAEAIRFARLAETGFFGPDADDPRRLSEIRYLKRAIIRGVTAELAQAPANVIAITSAMPAAGKTYLAASLGQALTLERDRSALLIDGDDVRCTLSKSLGQHGRLGFFDLLHDESLRSADLIRPTDLSGLSFMATGGRYSDSHEMLTSQRALAAVSALAAEDPSRLIIIDCPPLLGTPNGASLAALAGQVLVVVEAGVTDTETLKRALDLLGRERPVALVLNKVPRTGMLSSRVGSYYYYGARD